MYFKKIQTILPNDPSLLDLGCQLPPIIDNFKIKLKMVLLLFIYLYFLCF